MSNCLRKIAIRKKDERYNLRIAHLRNENTLNSQNNSIWFFVFGTIKYSSFVIPFNQNRYSINEMKREREREKEGKSYFHFIFQFSIKKRNHLDGNFIVSIVIRICLMEESYVTIYGV